MIELGTELGAWEVRLKAGGMVSLAAHAYSREQDDYVFVALAEGTPRYEIELARIPVVLVANIRGG